MKWELALLISLFAFAAAMVPRERRAVDMEELAKGNAGETPTSSPSVFCERKTPCGWIFYKSALDKVVEDTVPNTFCKCSDLLPCQAAEDDTTMSMFIMKCLEPGKGLINLQS